MTMSCHLITCLPEEGLFINKLSAPHRSSSPTTETGAIKSCLEQSNCSILQGTKVGSAKEHGQYISIPQRVSQQSVHPSPSKVTIKSQGSWVSSSRSQHSPAAYIFLTSIPGSLGPKIVPRRYIKHSVVSLPRYISKLPQENPIQFPQEVGIHLPKQ